jgi:hypothetical protein
MTQPQTAAETGNGLAAPSSPVPSAERALAAAVDDVIERWLGGGVEGWPCLSPLERELFLRDLLLFFCRYGIELRYSGEPIHLPERPDER